MDVIEFNGMQINKAAVKDMSYTELKKAFRRALNERQIDNLASACGIKKDIKVNKVNKVEKVEPKKDSTEG